MWRSVARASAHAEAGEVARGLCKVPAERPLRTGQPARGGGARGFSGGSCRSEDERPRGIGHRGAGWTRVPRRKPLAPAAATQHRDPVRVAVISLASAAEFIRGAPAITFLPAAGLDRARRSDSPVGQVHRGNTGNPGPRARPDKAFHPS